jgi:hypothetical protein
MARAKAGGEIGMNGEHYAGGTFMANTEMPKGTPRARKPQMVIVDGMKNRAVQPDDMRPIFELVFKGIASGWGSVQMAAKGEFVGNAVIEPIIARYNAGERFCTWREMMNCIDETPDAKKMAAYWAREQARKAGQE